MRLPLALAVIPARLASTRFPGKPLALLRGRPMIQHTLERVRQASLISRVVVATDDDSIRAAVEAVGGEAIMTRGDHLSGTDRVAEVAARPEFRDAYDIVVNVQGDEPGVDPAHIDAATRVLLADPAAVLSTLAAPIRGGSGRGSSNSSGSGRGSGSDSSSDISRGSGGRGSGLDMGGGREVACDRNVVKVVRSRTGKALYFSRALLPHSLDGTFSLARAAAGRVGDSSGIGIGSNSNSGINSGSGSGGDSDSDSNYDSNSGSNSVDCSRTDGNGNASGGPAANEHVYSGHGYLRHIGLYAYRASLLQAFPHLPHSDLEEAEQLEQLRILDAGYSIDVVVVDDTLPGVDTPGDLRALEARLEHLERLEALELAGGGNRMG